LFLGFEAPIYTFHRLSSQPNPHGNFPNYAGFWMIFI
jgi:hypothetical protein